MYVLAEADYSTTGWYESILSPLKNEGRRKRVQLLTAERADELPSGEACAFLLGGSVAWIRETVRALQASGCHPILLTEIEDGLLSGRFSRVRCDYAGWMERSAALGGRSAFYGMNPASISDIARREAFLSAHPSGVVFENNGSLGACFEAFLASHTACRFDRVICANDLAAASLAAHLLRCGADTPYITVQASGALLSYFPTVHPVRVDPTSLSAAAFEIADCIRAHPEFIGVTVQVAFLSDGEDTLTAARFSERTEPPSDAIYEDRELAELLAIERLFSSADETDLRILHLLAQGARDIGEEAFLSDNGVKYRIKKMKRICAAESKWEIPALLARYGIKM